MIQEIFNCAVFNNGVRMPWLGFGVFGIQDGVDVEKAVKKAFEVGYRSIDTASVYGNERGVGNAIRRCGIPREELFITTKVWNSEQGYDRTFRAFEQSMKKLNLDYLDLYLVHWPVEERFKETWRALEKLYHGGDVKAIGVSNFHIHHLKDLLNSCEIIPTINQIELHPLLTQVELREYCKNNQIQVEAWSPLARGHVLDHSTLVRIGRKYRKTTAQVIIRWDIQHGIVTIPKSSNPRTIAENAEVFDFELSDEDMERIDDMNEDRRIGPDPDNFYF